MTRCESRPSKATNQADPSCFSYDRRKAAALELEKSALSLVLSTNISYSLADRGSF